MELFTSCYGCAKMLFNIAIFHYEFRKLKICFYLVLLDIGDSFIDRSGNLCIHWDLFSQGLHILTLRLWFYTHYQRFLSIMKALLVFLTVSEKTKKSHLKSIHSSTVTQQTNEKTGIAVEWYCKHSQNEQKNAKKCNGDVFQHADFKWWCSVYFSKIQFQIAFLRNDNIFRLQNYVKKYWKVENRIIVYR